MSAKDNNLNENIKKIISDIGGKTNVVSATHCVSRLRIVLNDDSKIDKKELTNNDLVQGIFNANGQFQIIVGPANVQQAYKDFIDQTGAKQASKEDVSKDAKKKVNPLQSMVKTLGDIFIPILPVLITAGLLMGLNNVLTMGMPFLGGESIVQQHQGFADIADIINLIASTAFAFLPVFVGWSASKTFGGNPVLGVALGLILVNPGLLNAWAYGEAKLNGTVPTWDLFGLVVNKIGYQGQVLPVLIATWVMVKIEHFLENHTPKSGALFIVAPLSLLITGFLSFVIIGPVTFEIGNLISEAIIALFKTAPLVGGAIYGLLYAPLVITGMHHVFLAIDIQLIGSTGGTMLWPVLVLSNIAQGSAALGFMFLSKNKKENSLALSSAISAYLGITEPALFAVNLPYKYPLIAGMVSTAFTGALISVYGVQALAIGVGGLPGILAIEPQYYTIFAIAMGLSIILPIIFVVILKKVMVKKEIENGDIEEAKIEEAK